WSSIITLPGTLFVPVIIPEETAEVTVTKSDGPVQSVKVYLFSGTGSYLSLNETTDSNGQVSFDLPVGHDYKFRADLFSNQYWSAVTTILPGVNNVSIDAGGGTLQVTVEKAPGSPLEGINTYLFNTSGTYLGLSQTSDASGIVQFSVPAGDYAVRADYLGYQYWSVNTTVTGNTNISLSIPHQDVVITVQSSFQGAQDPVAGVNVYLFTSSGSYMSQYQTTDSNGQVTFNLPENSYKVRADYMSQQYWSNDFTWQNSTVNIPMADAQVFVFGSGQPLDGVNVYLFTGTGSYLSVYKTTDISGIVSFRVPSGLYKFRADYQSSQYWSETETLIADQINPVIISTGGGLFNFTVTKGAAPLTGIKCYLFSESGTYLSLNETTDSNGQVSFPLSDGNYKIRVDYLGNQFWSDVYTIPDTLAGSLDIPHQDVTITVQNSFQGAQDPVAGVNVYLFTSAGSYMSQYQATDINGQVTFNLPENSYKVRADYMSQQYWSNDFTWEDRTISIPHGLADVHVLRGVDDVAGARVYLFTSSSSYLSIYETTDLSGIALFQIPAGSYLFRADEGGDQKWSDIITVSPDQTTNLEINFSDSLLVTLSADPESILKGNSSILTWQSANAETVSIDQGIGEVGLSGTLEVFPATTTTYTITAENSSDTATDSVTIYVTGAPLAVVEGIKHHAGLK
ncbi:collagen binding domain-containing protein, partial [Thermodesulfobacteriota bacterium]